VVRLFCVTDSVDKQTTAPWLFSQSVNQSICQSVNLLILVSIFNDDDYYLVLIIDGVFEF